ncbi:hypothetical protein WJX72_005835 [[Myrmecia] bisecta]|uniref:Hexosyltransferase n=1 Tax=[Myrmecia] bisecta TaxID=41462 RepID=A0AAW1Q1V6_9CHLO
MRGSCRCGTFEAPQLYRFDLPVYVAPNTTAATASQEGVFLFIGVLSAGQNLQRRLAVREAWVTDGQITNVSVVRFVLSKDEWTPQVQQEADSFHDIVFVEEKTSYDSLLYKSYFVLEHAVTAHSARFVLKTDDDAFVNVRPLIRQLRLLCESADCRNERLYIGQMARDAPVQLDPKHKWNNVAFYNHTGLKQYPNYMMGGGYVLSGDVATALVKLHHMISLKFTPIEDATIAVWLMAMDVRQVDHPRFHSWAVPCCFKQPRWSGGQPLSVRLQLTDETEASVCGGDPWLLLHKIDQPFKMTFVGRRFRECEAEAEDPNQVPLSIAADVDGDKVDMAGETASTSSV